MASAPDRLVERLLDLGLSQDLVDASLPDWWTPAEAGSTSGKTLVSLLLARRLNLDPETLLDDGVPLGFLHTGPTKFKHMRLADGARKDALVGFAHGVSRMLFSAMPFAEPPVVPADARELRQALMGVRADLNLTHPADLNLTRGWVPAL